MRRLRPALAGLLLVSCTGRASEDPADRAAETSPLVRVPSDLPDRELPAFEEDAPEAPLSLTASDGTGLKLVSVKGRAVVEEPLAFTELHLTFENPEARTIEGRFTIDLPPDSAISRFAMKIGSRWQEGEVVERQAARVAYEDFLHRKQDPALLEKQAGNRFSARVFPIPANGRKELIVSFSQELHDSRVPYKLHLAGLPMLDELDLEVRDGETVTKVRHQEYEPQDIEVASKKADQAVGLRHGTLAVARVQAAGAMSAARSPIEGLTILFDTSASRALGFSQQVHRLGNLVHALGVDGDFPLQVIAFDQDASLVFDGMAHDFGPGQLAAIYSRRALGASDLSQALRRVALSGAKSRVLLLSDGISTAGKTETADLKLAAKQLADAGTRRVDAVIDGGLQDRDALTLITTAGLPEDGIVVDAQLPTSEVVDKLTRMTLSDVGISVPGSTFVWPKSVSGVQPGDEILVYAELPKEAAMKVVLEGKNRAEAKVELTNVARPLLERALMSARIDELTMQRSELANADLGEDRLKQKIVELSTKYRVLSDFTALLVLETEADYARFKIDRNALSDILTVGEGGIALQHREAATFGIRNPSANRGDPGRFGPVGGSPSDGGGSLSVGSDDEDVWGGLTGTEVGEAFGVGGLGLVGSGRGGGGTGEGTIGLGNVGLIGGGGGGSSGSGYGRGAGAGFGGRGKRVPRVRQAKAKVEGAMDKDIVRRIVRAHINEVRYCYNQGLARDPNLAGRLAVQFTISRSGKVPVAVVAQSTLGDKSVSNCIAKAVKRWKFPRPTDGGNVIVTYPFVFGSGGNTPPPTPEELEQQRQVIAAAEARRKQVADQQAREQAELVRTEGSPYTGKMFDVMRLIDAGEHERALSTALLWRQESPGDVLALVAMGEALEGLGKLKGAARAYGSLIDLFPARADLRRYAGYRLARLGAAGSRLAADTYGQAVEQRADHPNSHRLHAYALLRDGKMEQALEAIIEGSTRQFPEDRFRGVARILKEDVGLIGAAWIRAEPTKSAQIALKVHHAGATLPKTASTRFIMSWETDANDVDFHIHDGAGGHAYYSSKDLVSGGSLYADVVTGYGPECFTIEGTPSAFPYRFEANYYSRGPMGYGMGSLQILQHDGKGGLLFEERPFVIMKDRAFVKLGKLTAPLE